MRNHTPTHPIPIDVYYDINTWAESWVDTKKNSIPLCIPILEYRKHPTYDITVYAERREGESLYTFQHSPYERR